MTKFSHSHFPFTSLQLISEAGTESLTMAQFMPLLSGCEWHMDNIYAHMNLNEFQEESHAVRQYPCSAECNSDGT